MKYTYSLMGNPWPGGRRLVAALVALVYGGTNVVFCHAAEASFWTARRTAARKMGKPSAAALPSSNDALILAQLPGGARLDFQGPAESSVIPTAPPTEHLVGGKIPVFESDLPRWLADVVAPYGNMRDVYLSKRPGAPLVIQVQDLHDSSEAQRNIAGLVESLQDERGVSLVGLEGAQGAFATEAFRSFPDAEITKAVAEHFMEEGYLGGPEFAGITAKRMPLLWGVEDMKGYDANVAAVKHAAQNRPAVESFLREARRVMTEVKDRRLSVKLLEFDRHLTGYHLGKEPLGAYVRYLLKSSPLSVSHVPNLILLRDALHWEDSLDFKRIEVERTKLLERMVAGLSKASLNQLVAESARYRLGRISYGDYYRFLRTLCTQSGINLDEYSQLSAYVRYVLLAERINRNDLLTELGTLERAVQDSLAVTAEEKNIVVSARNLALLERLVAHAYTPADWAYQVTHQKEIMNVGPSIISLAQQTGIPHTLSPPTPEILQPFEDFCRQAVGRNAAMVQNLLEKMRSEKRATAVLVAGGFHTEGLTQLLRQKDISYAVVTPKVNGTLPDGHRSLDLLARDPAPLEKLFAGETVNIPIQRITNLGNGQNPLVSYLLSLFLVLVTALHVMGTNLPTQFGSSSQQILPQIVSVLGEPSTNGAVRVAVGTPDGKTSNYAVAEGNTASTPDSNKVVAQVSGRNFVVTKAQSNDIIERAGDLVQSAISGLHSAWKKNLALILSLSLWVKARMEKYRPGGFDRKKSFFMLILAVFAPAASAATVGATAQLFVMPLVGILILIPMAFGLMSNVLLRVRVSLAMGIAVEGLINPSDVYVENLKSEIKRHIQNGHPYEHVGKVYRFSRDYNFKELEDLSARLLAEIEGLERPGLLSRLSGALKENRWNTTVAALVSAAQGMEKNTPLDSALAMMTQFGNEKKMEYAGNETNVLTAMLWVVNNNANRPDRNKIAINDFLGGLDGFIERLSKGKPDDVSGAWATGLSEIIKRNKNNLDNVFVNNGDMNRISALNDLYKTLGGLNRPDKVTGDLLVQPNNSDIPPPFLQMWKTLATIVAQEGGSLYAGQGGDEFRIYLEGKDAPDRDRRIVRRYNQMLADRYDFYTVSLAKGDKGKLESALTKNLGGLAGQNGVWLVRHGGEYVVMVDRKYSTGVSGKEIQEAAKGEGFKSRVDLRDATRPGLGLFTLSLGGFAVSSLVEAMESEVVPDGQEKISWKNSQNGDFNTDEALPLAHVSDWVGNDALAKAKDQERNSFGLLKNGTEVKALAKDSISTNKVRLLKSRLGDDGSLPTADRPTWLLSQEQFRKEVNGKDGDFYFVDVTRYLKPMPVNTILARLGRLVLKTLLGWVESYPRLGQVIPESLLRQELKRTEVRAFHNLKGADDVLGDLVRDYFRLAVLRWLKPSEEFNLADIVNLELAPGMRVTNFGPDNLLIFVQKNMNNGKPSLELGSLEGVQIKFKNDLVGKKDDSDVKNVPKLSEKGEVLPHLTFLHVESKQIMDGQTAENNPYQAIGELQDLEGIFVSSSKMTGSEGQKPGLLKSNLYDIVDVTEGDNVLLMGFNDNKRAAFDKKRAEMEKTKGVLGLALLKARVPPVLVSALWSGMAKLFGRYEYVARRWLSGHYFQSFGVPFIEILLLPGLMYFAAPYFGLGLVIPFAALINTLLHGFPVSSRGPPRAWYQQTLGQFTARLWVSALIYSLSASVGLSLSLDSLSQLLSNQVQQLETFPTFVTGYVSHAVYNFVVPESYRLSIAKTEAQPGVEPGSSEKSFQGFVDSQIRSLAPGHYGVSFSHRVKNLGGSFEAQAAALVGGMAYEAKEDITETVNRLRSQHTGLDDGVWENIEGMAKSWMRTWGIPYKPRVRSIGIIRNQMGLVMANIGNFKPADVLRMVFVSKQLDLERLPVSKDKTFDQGLAQKTGEGTDGFTRNMTSDQNNLVAEINELWAPLAERLGADDYATDLRDKTLYVTQPQLYRKLAIDLYKLIDPSGYQSAGVESNPQWNPREWYKRKQAEVQGAMEGLTKKLQAEWDKELPEEGKPLRRVRIEGRLKSISSIYEKKGVDGVDEIKNMSDLVAISIILPSIEKKAKNDFGINAQEETHYLRAKEIKSVLEKMGETFNKSGGNPPKGKEYDNYKIVLNLNTNRQFYGGVFIELKVFDEENFSRYKTGESAHYLYNLEKRLGIARIRIDEAPVTKSFDDNVDLFLEDKKEFVYVGVVHEIGGATVLDPIRLERGGIPSDAAAHRKVDILRTGQYVGMHTGLPDWSGNVTRVPEFLAEEIALSSGMILIPVKPTDEISLAEENIQSILNNNVKLRTELMLHLLNSVTPESSLIIQGKSLVGSKLKRTLTDSDIQLHILRLAETYGFHDPDELFRWLATSSRKRLKNKVLKHIDDKLNSPHLKTTGLEYKNNTGQWKVTISGKHNRSGIRAAVAGIMKLHGYGALWQEVLPELLEGSPATDDSGDKFAFDVLINATADDHIILQVVEDLNRIPDYHPHEGPVQVVKLFFSGNQEQKAKLDELLRSAPNVSVDSSIVKNGKVLSAETTPVQNYLYVFHFPEHMATPVIEYIDRFLEQEKIQGRYTYPRSKGLDQMSGPRQWGGAIKGAVVPVFLGSVAISAAVGAVLGGIPAVGAAGLIRVASDPTVWLGMAVGAVVGAIKGINKMLKRDGKKIGDKNIPELSPVAQISKEQIKELVQEFYSRVFVQVGLPIKGPNYSVIQMDKMYSIGKEIINTAFDSSGSMTQFNFTDWNIFVQGLENPTGLIEMVNEESSKVYIERLKKASELDWAEGPIRKLEAYLYARAVLRDVEISFYQLGEMINSDHPSKGDALKKWKENITGITVQWNLPIGAKTTDHRLDPIREMGLALLAPLRQLDRNAGNEFSGIASRGLARAEAIQKILGVRNLTRPQSIDPTSVRLAKELMGDFLMALLRPPLRFDYFYELKQSGQNYSKGMDELFPFSERLRDAAVVADASLVLIENFELKKWLEILRLFESEFPGADEKNGYNNIENRLNGEKDFFLLPVVFVLVLGSAVFAFGLGGYLLPGSFNLPQFILETASGHWASLFDVVADSMAGMAGSISSIMQAYSGFEGRIVEAIGGAVFLGAVRPEANDPYRHIFEKFNERERNKLFVGGHTQAELESDQLETIRAIINQYEESLQSGYVPSINILQRIKNRVNVWITTVTKKDFLSRIDKAIEIAEIVDLIDSIIYLTRNQTEKGNKELLQSKRGEALRLYSELLRKDKKFPEDMWGLVLLDILNRSTDVNELKVYQGIANLLFKYSLRKEIPYVYKQGKSAKSYVDSMVGALKRLFGEDAVSPNFDNAKFADALDRVWKGTASKFNAPTRLAAFGLVLLFSPVLLIVLSGNLYAADGILLSSNGVQQLASLFMLGTGVSAVQEVFNSAGEAVTPAGPNARDKAKALQNVSSHVFYLIGEKDLVADYVRDFNPSLGVNNSDPEYISTVLQTVALAKLAELKGIDSGVVVRQRLTVPAVDALFDEGVDAKEIQRIQFARYNTLISLNQAVLTPDDLFPLNSEPLEKTITLRDPVLSGSIFEDKERIRGRFESLKQEGKNGEEIGKKLEGIALKQFEEGEAFRPNPLALALDGVISSQQGKGIPLSRARKIFAQHLIGKFLDKPESRTTKEAMGTLTNEKMTEYWKMLSLLFGMNGSLSEGQSTNGRTEEKASFVRRFYQVLDIQLFANLSYLLGKELLTSTEDLKAGVDAFNDVAVQAGLLRDPITAVDAQLRNGLPIALFISPQVARGDTAALTPADKTLVATIVELNRRLADKDDPVAVKWLEGKDGRRNSVGIAVMDPNGGEYTLDDVLNNLDRLADGEVLGIRSALSGFGVFSGTEDTQKGTRVVQAKEVLEKLKIKGQVSITAVDVAGISVDYTQVQNQIVSLILAMAGGLMCEVGVSMTDALKSKQAVAIGA